MAEQARHINLNDTNKLIRADLKREFPGVKFSVRGERASMMTATCISWTDGPDENAVDAVVANYRAKERDATGDYWDPRETTDAEGNRVYYGSDYVTVSRKISEGYMEAAKVKTAELMGVEEVHDHGYTPEDGVNMYAVEEFTGHPIRNGYAFGATLIHWVAGRLAECDYLGVDADAELKARRRQSDLEAATFQNVRANGGTFEDAHKAVRALTDPKAAQVDAQRAEEYAQAQQGTPEEAPTAEQWVQDRQEGIQGSLHAEIKPDAAQELIEGALGDLDPRYLASFAMLDHLRRHH